MAADSNGFNPLTPVRGDGLALNRVFNRQTTCQDLRRNRVDRLGRHHQAVELSAAQANTNQIPGLGELIPPQPIAEHLTFTASLQPHICQPSERCQSLALSEKLL